LVANNGIGLKRIDPQIPIFAIGRVGKDSEGDFALDVMAREGVDTSHIIRSDTERTGFTDVMSVSGGQRTFFTHAGRGGSFGYDDISWDDLRCRMLHLGYFLLLDRVDAGDGVRILQKAKEQGIMTSIDLVSENSDRYSHVLPSLPYVDNLILNELDVSWL
jgi:sugar/nucleoside kinase (ribokinase family)